MESLSERLRLLYEISRSLASLTDLDELERFATRRTRELFEADGCSLLLLDRDRNEFFFPISSQREGNFVSSSRLAEIRFPADLGVAGWVLRHGKVVVIPDARNDERFYDGVDQRTGVTTRNIICAPMRTREGTIGVVQVVNAAPDRLTEEDAKFLEALACDIAVAHQQARLVEQLRQETLSLRQVLSIAGAVLCIVGAVVVIGTAFAHLARALPVAQLISRPPFWTGAVSGVAGILLLSYGLAARRVAGSK
jgi:GAF domain-containing protein